ncbi:bacterio-opsin activator domain-containing protein [Salinibaculum salinum]|uniref:helix-turn-helix domain-containing protein n=1 Tax=Salinibaculum salinum TaxID=3131996 RepID=UPI0030ED3293
MSKPIGTEVSLASDHAVTAAVTLGGTVSYLTDIVRSAPFRRSGASVTVRGTIPYEEGFLQYVTLDGTDPETFMNTVTEQGVDVDITVIDEDHGRLQVQVSSEQPQSMLAQRGVVVRSTTVRPGGTTLTLELPAKNDLRAIVDELKDEFERAEVQSVFQTDANHEEQTGTELTAKQSAALQAAYHHGYFEQPRKNSASNVAAALDIAHSTFLQHLRTAQQKLFEPRFE